MTRAVKSDGGVPLNLNGALEHGRRGAALLPSLESCGGKRHYRCNDVNIVATRRADDGL